MTQFQIISGSSSLGTVFVLQIPIALSFARLLILVWSQQSRVPSAQR